MIRPARLADLERIAEIHASAWHAAYVDLIDPQILDQVKPATRLPHWQQWFADPDNAVSVYQVEEEIIGFSMVCPARAVASPPPGYGELTHLYLDPLHIGTGVGHELFEHAREHLHRGGFSGMLLWTLEGNARARAFYERHGMTLDGARQDEPGWLGEGVFEVRYQYPLHTRILC